MGKKEAKVTFIAETTQFNKGIKEADNNLKVLKSELKLNATQMKATGNDTNILKERLSTLKNESKATKDKTENLKDKLEVAKKTFGENSTEVANLTKRINDAKRSEEEIRQEIADVEGKIKSQTSAWNSNLNAVKGADEKIEGLNASLRLNSAQMEAVNNKGKLLKERMSLLKEEYSQSSGKVEQLEKALSKCEKEAGKNSDEYKELKKSLTEAKTEQAGIQGEIKRTKEALKEQNGILGIACEKINDYGEKIKGIGQKVSIASGAVAGIGLGVIKTAADFEQSMSKVQALSGATGDELQSLEDKAREMGKSTRYSAQESADAMSYMALAGWDTKDMLDGIGPVLNLAAASEMDLGRASDIVTDALTAFGLSAEDSGRFTDVLAAASVNANTNIEQLGEAFKYVAPVCGTLGYSAEDTSIALGLMANAGIKGSQAGTSLKTALANLSAPTDKQAAAMEKLGLSMTDSEGNAKTFMGVIQDLKGSIGGINVAVTDSEGNLKSYDEIIAEVSRTTDGLSKVQQIEAASTIFGKEAMSGMLAIVNSGDEDFAKLTDAVYNCNGAAADMAATMQDNLNGKITELKSKVSDVAIEFGQNLIPIAGKVVDKIGEVADWFGNLNEDQQQTILMIGGVVVAAGPLITAIGGIMTAINPVTLAIAGIITVGGLLIANWGNIKEAAADLEEKVVAIYNEMKEGCDRAIEEANQFLRDKWSSIKSTASEKAQAMKTSVSNAFATMKTSASTKVEELKSNVTAKFDGIRTGISTKINGAKDAVKTAIDKIKGFFNFSWSLPKLKMPHPYISGKFSLNPPQVPSFGISWYRSGGILNKPTIFGALGGNLLGGGEAGAEAVLPIDRLQGFFDAAIERTATMQYGGDMDRIVAAIEALANRPVNIYLNDKMIAKASAKQLDDVNGFRMALKNRGLAIE